MSTVMWIHTLEPAYSVISQFTKRGECGVKRVAAIIGQTEWSVRRWTYPAAMRGTGGDIPYWHYPKLIEAARKEGLYRALLLLQKEGTRRAKKAG